MWQSDQLGKGFREGNYWREPKLKQMMKILTYGKSAGGY